MMMDTDAVQQYFKDISVNLDDITCFIASQIVQCPSLGEITKDGFVNGWSDVNCETVAKQKTHIAACKKQVGDPSKPELLDKVYKYTFKLLLQGPGQRIVDKDTCISLWRILFVPPSLDWSTPRTKWLDVWCEFIEERSSAKGINADLWNQVLKFAKNSVADDTLGFWNEEQSWPALIDEFVAYVKETRGDAATAGEDEMEIE
jgi:DCN1-like protein 1/2